jgi:hypothetical protein
LFCAVAAPMCVVPLTLLLEFRGLRHWPLSQ